MRPDLRPLIEPVSPRPEPPCGAATPALGDLHPARVPILIAALAIVVLATPPLAAQELPFKHYTPQKEVNPLPMPAVTSAYQDRLGYLWIANYGLGLVRYDGQHMEVYEAAEGELSSSVFTMQEDGEGRLWAISSAGLFATTRPLGAYPPGARVQFSNEVGGTPLYADPISLPINVLASDTRGGIWLGTRSDGLVRYRFDGPDALVTDTLPTPNPMDDPAAPSATVLAVAARSDGSVWASLEGGGLVVSKSGDLDVEAVPEPPPCDEVRVLYEDTSGVLWGGCAGHPVWRLEEHGDEQTFVEVGPPLEGQITSLEEVAPGVLWAAGLGLGIWELNADAPGQALRYSRRNGLLDANVWDLSRDREGGLWVAQNTGLSRLRASQDAYRSFTANSHAGEQPALPGEALSVEPDVRVPLAAGDTASVVAVGTAEGIALIRKDGTSAHLTEAQGLGSGIVLDVCRDSDGELWAATRQGAVQLRLSGAGRAPPRGSARQTTVVLGQRATLHRYDLGIINNCAPLGLLDASGGVCFAKGSGLGLACLAGGQWFGFGRAAGLPGEGLWSVVLDADRFLWVGSMRSGLFRTTRPLSLALLRALPSEPSPQDGFGLATVTAPLFEPVLDPAGEPLAGSSVQGLLQVGHAVWAAGDGHVFVLEGSPPRVAHRFDEEALGDKVHALALSPTTGTVWAAGRAGLHALDPDSLVVVRHIRQHHGILSDVSSGLNGLVVSRDGTLYQATSSGVSRYRPAQDVPGSVPPVLAFRHVSFSEDAGGHNELEARYAALSFGDEKQVRYRTRLVGYDAAWSASTAEPRIRYTNLSAFAFPKTYTLEVTAANEEGVWSETPLTYQIQVHPAWWLRWWALAAYAVAFIAGAFLVDRVQRRRLIERERAQAERREIALRTEAAEARARYLQAENERKSQALEQAAAIERAYEDLRETKDRLVQQEKLASLGRLTAGIAHEIKNPLNFVTNFADVSRELAGELRGALAGRADPAPILDDLEQTVAVIGQHGRRADGIVKSMMQHARATSGEREAVDLNALVREHVALAYHGRRAQVPDFTLTLEEDFDGSVGEIAVQPQELGRVVVNLVTNAFDAVAEHARSARPSGDGEPYAPRVTVSTERTDGHVEIRVADNGTGIPASLRAEIFEPFFTTKPTGSGTGLGLSLSHDIVTQGHGGTLSVEDAQGGGAVFVVRLPSRPVG